MCRFERTDTEIEQPMNGETEKATWPSHMFILELVPDNTAFEKKETCQPGTDPSHSPQVTAIPRFSLLQTVSIISRLWLQAQPTASGLAQNTHTQFSALTGINRNDAGLHRFHFGPAGEHGHRLSQASHVARASKSRETRLAGSPHVQTQSLGTRVKALLTTQLRGRAIPEPHARHILRSGAVEAPTKRPRQRDQAKETEKRKMASDTTGKTRGSLYAIGRVFLRRRSVSSTVARDNRIGKTFDWRSAASLLIQVDHGPGHPASPRSRVYFGLTPSASQHLCTTSDQAERASGVSVEGPSTESPKPEAPNHGGAPTYLEAWSFGSQKIHVGSISGDWPLEPWCHWAKEDEFSISFSFESSS